MNGRPVVGLTSVLHKHGQLADRQTQRHALPELSMGWVGSGWVKIFQFFVGCVGLGPLQQKY